MYYFSYNDYIDFSEKIRYKIHQVEDTEEKYEINNNSNIEKNKQDIVKILKNKDEMYHFLRKFMKYNIAERKSIKYCKTKKVDSDNSNYENITYRISNEEKYIFIKVIDKIDSNISYKILDHSLQIINDWNLKETKNKIKPIVIPIIIYIGKKEWNNYNKKNTKRFVNYYENKIEFSYNIFKLYDYKIENLVNDSSKISKNFLKLVY